MTQPKLHNTLYSHLKATINGALQLEYAIRSMQLSNPGVMEEWAVLGREIRAYWLDLGVADALIDAEDLMDFAWDTIQVGFLLTHIHGRVYPDQEFLAIIEEGLSGVQSAFRAKLEPLLIPITRYFRICDLLRGNDIPRLLTASAECIQRARKYNAKDEIRLSAFIKNVRVPIALHPGFQFVSSHDDCDGQAVDSFGFTLDTEVDISFLELKRLTREFLYQYAVYRLSFNKTKKSMQISNDLINDFLRAEFYGCDLDYDAPRHDSFVTKLSGIHCWDQFQYNRAQGIRSALDLAIKNTLAIYPKQAITVSEDAIKKNYNEARKKILGLNFK